MDTVILEIAILAQCAVAIRVGAVLGFRQFLRMFTVQLDQLGRRGTDRDGWPRDIGICVGKLSERCTVIEDLNDRVGVTGVSKLAGARERRTISNIDLIDLESVVADAGRLTRTCAHIFQPKVLFLASTIQKLLLFVFFILRVR